MHDAHFSINPNRSAKQQALTVIALLKQTIPIARAQMRVQLVLPPGEKLAAKAHAKLSELNAVIESQEQGKAFRAVKQQTDEFFNSIVNIQCFSFQTCVIDPGAFRAVEALVNDLANGNGSLEVCMDFPLIFGVLFTICKIGFGFFCCQCKCIINILNIEQ